VDLYLAFSRIVRSQRTRQSLPKKRNLHS